MTHTVTWTSSQMVLQTGTLQVTCSQRLTFLQTVTGQHSYCGQFTHTLRQTVRQAGAHGAQLEPHGSQEAAPQLEPQR